MNTNRCIFLDIRSTSLENRASDDYKEELKDRKGRGLHAYATTINKINQMASDPERGYDDRHYWAREEKNNYIKVAPSSGAFQPSLTGAFWVEIRISRSRESLDLDARWGDAKRAGMKTQKQFLNFCAGAVIYACDRKQVQPNSIKTVRVRNYDSFEASVLQKLQRGLEGDRTIKRGGRKDEEFLALLGGSAGSIISAIRPSAQRFLKGTHTGNEWMPAAMNSETIFYPGGNQEPYWVFDFGGAPPPEAQCDPPPYLDPPPYTGPA